jgi:hypothetical protein
MHLRILFFAACALIVVSMLSAPADAQGPVILGMTEAPTQPCDGLKVQGITLNYIGPSCTFNFPNGGTLTYTSDPTIEGDVTGTLTMTFSAPTTYLQFGVVYSGFSTGTVQVQLFDPAGNPLGGPILVTTNPLVSFSEGLFVSNQADKLIGKAVITFPNPAGARFAVDNVVTTPFENFLYFFH